MKHLIATLLLIASASAPALADHPLADESQPVIHEIVTLYSNRFERFVIPDSNADEVMGKVHASVKVLIGIYGTCSTFYNVTRDILIAQATKSPEASNALGIDDIAANLTEMESQMYAHVQMFVTAYMHVFPNMVDGSAFLHGFHERLPLLIVSHRQRYIMGDMNYWDTTTMDCRQVSGLLELMDSLALKAVEHRK